MNFLNGLKIDLAAVPDYEDFKMVWAEQLDNNILEMLFHSEEKWNKPQLKSVVKSSILSHIDKTTDILSAKHYQKFQKDGKSYGRFYPTKYSSLSVMPRHYKHTVYSLLGWKDVDMKSAHPTIIFEAFKNQGDILESYAEYINNKDQITADLLQWFDDPENPVLDAEDIKYLFNLTTFGGNLNTWIFHIETEPWKLLNGLPDPNWVPRKVFNKNLHPFYGKYYDDTEFARNKITQANRDLVELAIASRQNKDKDFGPNDLQKTTMSLFCSIIENEILNIAYQLLLVKNIMKPRRGGLEMDGLNIPKPECGWENVDCDAILTELNKKVKNDTNLGVKFVWKGYKESNVHLTLEQVAGYKARYSISLEQVIDPCAASEVIAKTLNQNLKLCKENWIMLGKNQLWKKQKEPSYFIIKEMHKYLDSIRESLNQYITKSEGDAKQILIKKLELWLKHYTNISKPGYLSVLTKCLRPLLTDDDFDKKLDNNKGKLAFKNGIMDLETKIFREGIEWDDFITETIPHNYQPSDFNFVKSKLKEILNNNDEHLEYFLSIIGYSFIGQPDLEKSIYFMIDKTEGGKGDNGKTFFFDIMNDLMPNYVYRTKPSLIEKNNAKVHKQLAMTKGKRLVWMEEVPKEQDTSAALLKELGDGKQIENEVMFGTSETIDVMFKLFALSNHCFKMDPSEIAVYNRFKQCSFNSNFDRTGTRTESNPAELKFIADTSLSTTIKEKYHHEVFNLIIHYANLYYKNKIPAIPAQFVQDAKETQSKNDEFGIWFDGNCEKSEGKKIAELFLIQESGMNRKLVREGMERKGFKYNKDLSGLGKDCFDKPYKGGYKDVIIKVANDDDDGDNA